MNGHDPDALRLDLLGRPVPSGFDVQVVMLGPGCELCVVEVGTDALVEVDDGQVELELSSGVRRQFGAGDLLCLLGGRLRALPAAPAVVIAIWRLVETGPQATGGVPRDEKSGDCRLNTHDDTRERHDHRPWA